MIKKLISFLENSEIKQLPVSNGTLLMSFPLDEDELAMPAIFLREEGDEILVTIDNQSTPLYERVLTGAVESDWSFSNSKLIQLLASKILPQDLYRV